jgi:drug/metabolite transporter (DMT)-like permease
MSVILSMRPETVKPFEIETISKLQPLPSTPWASEASHMIVRTVEQVRRAFRIVAGFTLLLAGVVMIVTPGPGWLVIFLGLSLLAAEFIWARRLMERMKREGGRVRDAVWSIGKGAPPTSAASDSSQAEAQKTE